LLQPPRLDLGTAGLTGDGQFCQKDHKQFVGVNQCAGDVTITSIHLGAGAPFDEISAPALPLVVPAGTTSAPFVFGFTPSAAGESYGFVKLQTDLLASPFGVTLQGKAIAGTQATDVFEGNSTPEVDILWVIDTDDLNLELTCCGAPPNLLDKLSEFTGSVQGIDYQMGLVADDCPVIDNGNIEPCPGCYNNGDAPTIITPTTPDPGQTLMTMIQTISKSAGGFGCPNYEAPVVAAWEALQPGLLSGHNAGFLRDNASLAVIAYDPDGNLEDEGSPQEPDFYINFFASLKGGDKSLISASLMYADVYDGWIGTKPGPRYQALAKDSGGALIDTFGKDWTTQVTNLWTNIAGGSGIGAMILSGTPIPSTIEIWLDGPPAGPGVSAPGIQIPQQNSSGSSNWTYAANSNSIVLNSQFYTIGATDTLTVVYSLSCH
jgi:hypothetical protein